MNQVKSSQGTTFPTAKLTEAWERREDFPVGEVSDNPCELSPREVSWGNS